MNIGKGLNTYPSLAFVTRACKTLKSKAPGTNSPPTINAGVPFTAIDDANALLLAIILEISG